MTAVGTAPGIRPVLEKGEDSFFVAMAAGMTAVVLAGFARSFFLRAWFPELETSTPPEMIFYVHGTLFTTWMALLVIQPSLVKAGRIDLHRKLGWFGAALAVVMVLIGTYGALVAAARPHGFFAVPVPPFVFLAVPIFDMLLFSTFVGLAIRWRRDTPRHKRLMLLATVNLLAAPFARIPVASLFVLGPLTPHFAPAIFILALATWDFLTTRRLHAVTLWGGLASVLSQPLRLMIGETDAWHAFAGWATGLVG